jgi:hypothetical protein
MNVSSDVRNRASSRRFSASATSDKRLALTSLSRDEEENDFERSARSGSGLPLLLTKSAEKTKTRPRSDATARGWRGDASRARRPTPPSRVARKGRKACTRRWCLESSPRCKTRRRAARRTTRCCSAAASSAASSARTRRKRTSATRARLALRPTVSARRPRARTEGATAATLGATSARRAHEGRR